MKTTKSFRNREGWLSRVMKTMLAAVLVVSIVIVYSCRKTDDVSPASAQTDQQLITEATGLISATGLLKKSGITTYQYGAYVLIVTGQNTSYALRSNTFNL